ncbi:hypothetical protein [Nocardia cyriacigeorgica]|uniref:hypothetical protein n=1 Tax=Nocardia cyriacigeorgica TaxID=135487 RepID=UPI001485D3EC|nr:hypothetical protein [Nocardia cyriacigeorgica]
MTIWDVVLVLLVVSLLVVTGAALLWPVRGSSTSADECGRESDDGSRIADES